MKEANSKQRKEIQKHLIAIDKKDLRELRHFDEQWQNAKPDLAEVVYTGVDHIIQLQLAYLLDITPNSVAKVIEVPELKFGEI